MPHACPAIPSGTLRRSRWRVGKSLGEICEQIKDPKRNGGKSMDELVHHMAEDLLVGWG